MTFPGADFTAENQILTGLERLAKDELVAAALSGGVDSTMAAATLLRRGHRVAAVHLVLTPEALSLAAARQAAAFLNLDLTVVDLSEDFERLVVAPFVQGYVRGETPSPCVLCNPVVKFGLLWDVVNKMGAAALATGHYAGLTEPAGSGGPLIIRSKDRTKDQTYFLCRLTSKQLGRTVFPLALASKSETQSQARVLGFSAPEESQDICFLSEGDYRSLIQDRLGREVSRPGLIVDSDGRALGRHQGLIHYTIGQRRGLGLPGPEPYYVLKLDPEKNQVVIGPKNRTLSESFTVRETIFNSRPSDTSFVCQVQIRSRHVPSPARVSILTKDRIRVVFDRPQSAVTAGQAAAFYQGDVLLGGGWIERPDSDGS